MSTRKMHEPSPLTLPVTRLGRGTIALVSEMGAMALFMFDGMSHIISRGQFSKVIRQLYFIGAGSLFLITCIGLFTGMVLGLQGYYTLTKFGSEGMLGSAVALSLIRELGPALTAIMVAGRAGSAMAAEIGVMRITDQIDALDVMDINSVSYLISPRLLASIIVFPMLTAVFDVVGIIGGYLTGVVMLGINPGIFFYRMELNVEMVDVSGGFIKSLAFAALVSIVSCYMGYYAHLRRDGVGPEAVSNAITSAVVMSCVLILCSDYVMTSLLM